MKNINKIITFTILLLILISFVFAETELKDFNYYSFTSVELYEPLTNKYSSKFEVPDYILKSLIGIETEGIVNRQEFFNNYGEIGLTHLRPFDELGNSIHYDLCVESECMNEIKDLSSDIEAKRKQIESEYLDIDNSICCAAYVLKQKYGSAVDFPSNPANCEDLGVRTYTEWDAALRRFKGLECSSESADDYFNYVEKVNQLVDIFMNIADYSTSTFGLLRFTPSFSIAAPTLINTFDKLPSLVKDLQTSQTESDVIQKLDNFAAQNKVTFGYCEAPEINVFNSFYDRVTGAFDSEEINCKYRLTNNDVRLFGDNPGPVKNVVLDLELYDNNLIIKNGLPTDSNLYKEFSVPFFSNSNTFIDSIHVLDKRPSIQSELSYDIFLTNAQEIASVKNIYLHKQNGEVEFLFAVYNSEGMVEYYNSTLELIEDVPDCQKKYRYFTCLDTNQTEEVYNWGHNKWVESDETIKIKFSFAIPKVPN